MKRLVLLVSLILCLHSLQGQNNNYSMTNGTVTIQCSQSPRPFLDPGGNTNYGNNLNVTQTFVSSDPNRCLQVVFTSFNTEDNYDFLYVYEGTSATGTPIETYSGNLGVFTVTSSSGALTFKFQSDASSNHAGWYATVSCVVCPEIVNMGNGTTTTCNAVFYDSGGPSGNYGNNQNYTHTFFPATPGMCLKVKFTSFQLQSAGWFGLLNDYLTVYDGENTSSPQIGRYYGSNSPGTIYSTNGALTFVFHSNSSSTYSGWSATVTCVECSNIPCMSDDNGSPCSIVTHANPFCTDENPYGVQYPSNLSGNASIFFPSGTPVGCLSTTPYPAWYYMQISTPGNLIFQIRQTGGDVDFACWGPFTATDQADFMEKLCCGQYSFTTTYHSMGSYGNVTYSGYPDGNLIDCGYSASSTEWCHIPNAQQGDWYLLLITNYSRQPGTYSFYSGSGSTATTNCSLLAPFTYNNPVCVGDTLILTCANSVNGATAYNWSGPNGWTDTTTVPTVSIPNVTLSDSGQYSLLPTGPSINASTSHIDVTISPVPTVSVTANHDTICTGTSVTLTASGAGSYRWMPGNTSGQTKTVSPTTTVDAGSISNTYTVTGTTGGCSNTASYTIVVNPKPTASITPASVTICKDDTATLYASGGANYEWRLGNNTTTFATGDSIRVSPQSNATYRVIATNAYGCTSSASKSVTVRPLPTASISGNGQICRGDSVLLTASSASSYLWSNGATTRTVWVHPVVTTDYEVIVANTYGCTATATKNIIVSMSDSTSYRDTVCRNQTYQDANFTIVGIREPGTYRYETTFSTTASCDSMVVLYLTVRPMSSPEVVFDTACVSYTWRGTTYTQSGVYCDSIFDADGCLRIDTLHLVINNTYDIVQTEEVCESFTWINGVTYTESTNTPVQTLTASNLCDSVVHLHLTVYHADHEYITKDTCTYYDWHGTRYTEGGLYTFPSIDANGCPYTDTLLLSLYHASPSSMSAHACDSYEWNGTTYTTTGVYTYGHADVNGCWQTDTLYLTITPPSHQSATIAACEKYVWYNQTYTQSGQYLHALTDANGCVQVDTLHLTIYNAVPNVEHVIICEPNTYTWHGFQFDVTSVHTYNYLDEHNCPCVDTLYLTVTTEPELVLNMVLDATCNQNNGEIKVHASGGTAPYRYVFLPDGNEAFFEGLSVGFYHLQMIDSIGCTADAEFSIENIIHQVNLVSVQDAHCGMADGMVEVAASGGFGQFSYHWSNPIVSESNVAEHVRAGQYDVTVVDSNGCSLSLVFNVHDIPGPDACFYFNVSNEKEVIMVNCTPEENLIHWNWSFGDGHYSDEWQPTHKYADPGEYPVVLTVVDENNCIDSLSLQYVIREVLTMYLPSAFIPESEIAENRVFKPVGNSISGENYEMLVYDRWGQLIFVSRHPEYGWDGYINGRIAPQGTYSYRIMYQDMEGKPNSITGAVLLLRGKQN